MGRTEKRKRQKNKDQEEERRNKLESLKPDRRLGSLYLSEYLQEKRRRRMKTSQTIRSNAFITFVDAENIKRQMTDANFDIHTLAPRIASYLKSKNPDAYLLEVVAVGNMYNYVGEDGDRLTNWEGVKVHDIFPRNAFCKTCGHQIQSARRHLREPVAYEKVTDVADDLLQHLMFCHVRKFGVPCNILIITADGDFTRAIQILRKCGARIFLARPTSCNPSLPPVANDWFYFEQIMETPLKD